MKHIWNASKIISTHRRYFYLLLLIGISFFFVLIMVPVFSVPGNTLGFQLSIFRFRDLLIMFVLSTLSALVITMQIYILWTNRKMKAKQNAGVAMAKTGGTGLIALFAAISSTAACSSCLVFVLSIVGLGFGTSLFILQYQIYFLIGALLLILISLHYTSKRMMGICETCNLHNNTT